MNESFPTKNLVSAEWLHKHLKDHDLIILDSSIKSAIADTHKLNHGFIPSSRFFDLKNVFCDKSSSFPNTFPSENQFENECKKLGINQSSKIIVYDNLGIHSSPRVWWMFKTMGHDHVFVLNGGFPEWIKKGYKIQEEQDNHYNSGNFKATFKSSNVKSYTEVLNNISDQKYLLIDARSQGRFNGIDKEPRKHLRSGHIPNSINIPYQEVLENGKFKPAEKIKDIFEQQLKNPQDLIFSCGSGVTACIILLAYEIAYHESEFVYDGSWTEWAELQNLKVDHT